MLCTQNVKSLININSVIKDNNYTNNDVNADINLQDFPSLVSKKIVFRMEEDIKLILNTNNFSST